MSTLLSIFLVITSITVGASKNDNKLLGKWNVEFEESKETAIYEVKETDGKLETYGIEYTNEDGQTQQGNERVMTNIKKDKEQWTANYQYDYQGTNIQGTCVIVLKKKNKIEVTYDYQGYKFKEQWTRRN